MKVLILAGGYGSRLSEETINKPKPMVEIGEKPILWHIMKIYSFYGYNDFIILCGYKGYIIKEYFSNYYRHMADMTIDMVNNSVEYHVNNAEPWKVTMIDTGEDTMTGGRVKKARKYIGNNKFMLTYGDGVADVNIRELVNFHNKKKGLITMTTVQPEGRFGALVLDEDSKVRTFMEKPKGDGAWINGGFFVCEPKILDYIENDSTIFEREPLEKLSKDGELFAYKHKGFWLPMDTMRDKNFLETSYKNGTAPWIKW